MQRLGRNSRDIPFELGEGLDVVRVQLSLPSGNLPATRSSNCPAATTAWATCAGSWTRLQA